MTLTYRLLDASEWGRLTEVVDDLSLVPHPSLSLAAVAEDGQLQGALFAQPQLHFEPLILRHPTVNFLRLYTTLHDGVHGANNFVFAPTAKIERMAELAGMKKIPWTVWYKE